MPICDYMAICDYCQSAILDNLYYNVYCFIEQREENPVKCYFIIFWFTVIMKVIKLVILILFDQISDFLILWRPSWIYAN